MTAFRRWLPWAGAALLISIGLILADPSKATWPGYFGFLILSLLAAVLLSVSWQLTAADTAPRAVSAAFLVALALRLVVGVGLVKGLPVYGYDTKPQRQGYVFYDAYARDSDAWARARSNQPLTNAFTERRSSDQYGGLLFLSSAVYRYLSDGYHRPLLIVLLAASVSSLAVLFAWGFAGMVFGGTVGLVAAWLVALFPDNVLLGASQMREAFVIPGLALALYGYARMRTGDSRGGLWAAAIGGAVALFVSPPYGLLAWLLFGGLWLLDSRLSRRASIWLLSGLSVGLVLAAVMTMIAWSSIGGMTSDSPAGLFLEWVSAGAVFQLSQLEAGSGWVQKMFELTPVWAHLPLATGYGLIQPFLPAALADNSGATIWRGIAIWRALGWFGLLPALIYAPLAALRANSRRRILLFLALVVWSAALMASFRAAGDQWDNPRYRTAVLVPQAILAGWAWVRARRAGDPWLSRTYIAVFGSALLFLQWYLGRYYGTPRLNLNETLVLTVVFLLSYVGVSWWLDRRIRRRNSGESPA
ncbi:MAG: hypothetical protein WBR18_08230 [Anaerolineales bacterium]